MIKELMADKQRKDVVLKRRQEEVKHYLVCVSLHGLSQVAMDTPSLCNYPNKQVHINPLLLFV